MRIDWWTLALQTINLLVLLWILGRFLFRPVARMLAERQAEAGRLLDDAAARTAAAEATAKAAEAERQAAQAARAGALDQAHAEAEAQRAALLDAARAEAARLREAAEAGIARQRQEDELRIGNRATALAGDIAARLLGQAPGRIPLAAFLPGFAQTVAGLPEAARAAIGAGGAPVAIATAAPLAEPDRAALAATLATALGREVALAPRVDPDLIAGLRLETPEAIVRNDLRADLDHIATELLRHDA